MIVLTVGADLPLCLVSIRPLSFLPDMAFTSVPYLMYMLISIQMILVVNVDMSICSTRVCPCLLHIMISTPQYTALLPRGWSIFLSSCLSIFGEDGRDVESYEG